MGALKIENQVWYYEQQGERRGPVGEEEIVTLISTGFIQGHSQVWRTGYPDWVTAGSCELKAHFRPIQSPPLSPPPLNAVKINNSMIWILAFAPFLGIVLQAFIAEMVYGSTADFFMDKFWYMTLILNIALSAMDEHKLRLAGHTTENMKGWVWLVPVYLYKRSEMLKQDKSYFATWMVCFFISLYL